MFRATVVVLALALGASLASSVGLLPEWANPGGLAARAIAQVDTPASAEVDYPVFGSNDLVTHLARGMVAQDRAIEVTHWMRADGTAAVSDAMQEALTQNPYIFAEGWELADSGVRAEVRPYYSYDATEAERRRSLTQAAVTVGLAESGASTAVADADKVTRIHDYIAARGSYDWAAFEAIERGESTPIVQRSQEAYGILVDGTAVCNGYAQAFLAMANAAGLDAVQVTGSDSAGVTGGNHAWNKVRVDGEWLLVDVTWDDTDAQGPPRRDYLMAPDGAEQLATRVADDTWIMNDQMGTFGT